MEVTHQGGSSFQIRGERTVVINPGGAAGKGEIVLRSRRGGGKKDIVVGPGEYEIGGVLIVTTAMGPRESGALAHAVEVDGINVLFMDEHVASLSAETATAAGPIDVLIVRADDARAARELAQDVSARTVIPFGEKAAELCAALGVKDAPVSGKFSWNGVSGVPKAVMLKAHVEKKAVGGKKKAA